jgi:hypothetical protein
MSLSISRFLRTLLTSFVLAFSWGNLAEAVTLHFKERITQWEPIDLGATGSSLVDLDAGNGILLDLKGNPIGTMDFQSVLTNIKAISENRWLNVQYNFRDGLDSIIIQGIAEQQSDTGLQTKDTPYYYAITGGTGKYAGAKGVCKVVRETDAEWINTCKFQVLKIKF